MDMEGLRVPPVDASYSPTALHGRHITGLYPQKHAYFIIAIIVHALILLIYFLERKLTIFKT
jgi:hypothetical protein